MKNMVFVRILLLILAMLAVIVCFSIFYTGNFRDDSPVVYSSTQYWVVDGNVYSEDWFSGPVTTTILDSLGRPKRQSVRQNTFYVPRRGTVGVLVDGFIADSGGKLFVSYQRDGVKKLLSIPEFVELYDCRIEK